MALLSRMLPGLQGMGAPHIRSGRPKSYHVTLAVVQLCSLFVQLHNSGESAYQRAARCWHALGVLTDTGSVLISVVGVTCAIEQACCSEMLDSTSYAASCRTIKISWQSY